MVRFLCLRLILNYYSTFIFPFSLTKNCLVLGMCGDLALDSVQLQRTDLSVRDLPSTTGSQFSLPIPFPTVPFQFESDATMFSRQSSQCWTQKFTRSPIEWFSINSSITLRLLPNGIRLCYCKFCCFQIKYSYLWVHPSFVKVTSKGF